MSSVAVGSDVTIGKQWKKESHQKICSSVENTTEWFSESFILSRRRKGGQKGKKKHIYVAREGTVKKIFKRTGGTRGMEFRNFGRTYFMGTP